MRYGSVLVLVLGSLIAGSLVAARDNSDQQAAATSVESSLLQAVAERPSDPSPFIELARYYYGARRLELATRTIAAAVTIGRDTAARPQPPPVPPAIRRAGIDVPLPVRTRHQLPTPSLEAVHAGATGVVVVEADIDSEGRVQGPRVVQSVPMLDEAAIKAVRDWRFDPVVVDGSPVSVKALLAVDITYRSEPEPERDLALAAFYVRSFLYSEAEPRLLRALDSIQGELNCYGPDDRAAARPRVGQRGQRGRGSTAREGAWQIEPPRKVHDVTPRYPPAAQAARVEGIVILEALIAADGAVRCARVLRSVPILDQAALDAVRQWRYAPTLLDGRPVDIVMTVTMTFSLRRLADGSVPVVR